MCKALYYGMVLITNEAGGQTKNNDLTWVLYMHHARVQSRCNLDYKHFLKLQCPSSVCNTLYSSVTKVVKGG